MILGDHAPLAHRVWNWGLHSSVLVFALVAVAFFVILRGREPP